MNFSIAARISFSVLMTIFISYPVRNLMSSCPNISLGLATAIVSRSSSVSTATGKAVYFLAISGTINSVILGSGVKSWNENVLIPAGFVRVRGESESIEIVSCISSLHRSIMSSVNFSASHLILKDVSIFCLVFSESNVMSLALIPITGGILKILNSFGTISFRSIFLCKRRIRSLWRISCRYSL